MVQLNVCGISLALLSLWCQCLAELPVEISFIAMPDFKQYFPLSKKGESLIKGICLKNEV